MKRVMVEIDNLINFLLLLLLLLAILFSIYSIWDEKVIYNEADPAIYKSYRPNDADSMSFEELKKKNPDIFGWLSIYGTNIDYPLLQSSGTNQKYVHTNALGEYSMVGSLFLDYRNNKNFTDFNNIIYGHHMEANVMFSEIDKFENKKFFKSHKYGNVFYNGKNHGIRLFAFIDTDAYNTEMYTPAFATSADRENYLAYIKENAKRYRNVPCTIDDNLIAFSTCASDYSTNGRYILIGKITDKTYKNKFKNETKSLARSKLGLLDIIPLWVIATIMLLIGLLFLLVIQRRNMYSEDEQDNDNGSSLNE